MFFIAIVVIYEALFKECVSCRVRRRAVMLLITPLLIWEQRQAIYNHTLASCCCFIQYYKIFVYKGILLSLPLSRRLIQHVPALLKLLQQQFQNVTFIDTVVDRYVSQVHHQLLSITPRCCSISSSCPLLVPYNSFCGKPPRLDIR